MEINHGWYPRSGSVTPINSNCDGSGVGRCSDYVANLELPRHEFEDRHVTRYEVVPNGAEVVVLVHAADGAYTSSEFDEHLTLFH
jgi:hypothetical protein